MAVIGITAAGAAFLTVSIDITWATPLAGSASGIDEIGVFPACIGITSFVMRCAAGFVITNALGGIGKSARRAVNRIGIDICFAEALCSSLDGICTKCTA